MKFDMMHQWENCTLIENLLDHVELSEQENCILDLVVLGTTNINICWLLGIDNSTLNNLVESIEEKLKTNNISQAGAVLRDRHEFNPISISARLAETRLRILTGARILSPIVAGDSCGLRCILADGSKVDAWIHASEEIDFPGDIRIFRSGEDGEIVHDDEICGMLEKIHQIMGGTPNKSRQARLILEDLVERAINIIDDLDENSEAEGAVDDEIETDKWLNPISLNPNYQREPFIYLVHRENKEEIDEKINEETYPLNIYGCSIDYTFTPYKS